ncbi:SURF1 family protein [Pseudactinotalea sp. Z1748]|uniref:SURF1 family protein n=1 Tax=Pseudactinotalea sp. Z1748 TaxID=3413027 RepID=UPI003C7C59D3
MDQGLWRQWLRAATKPRLLGILVILLIGALVCVRLGMWQLDRAQVRGDQVAAMEQAERESAPPQPLGEVVGPQTQLVQEMVGVRVIAEGVYEQEDQFFVVGRSHEGEMGYWVLTALVLGEGEHAGAVVPVVRGWVPEADPDLLTEVPSEPVRVLAHLAPSEGAGARLPEPHLVDAVSSAQLVNVWGGPIYSAHLRLISAEPEVGPPMAQVGPPEIADAGLNVQNLAYAAEWWIFGGFALFLWWRMVRDEVRYDREQAAKGHGSAPAGWPGGAPGGDDEREEADRAGPTDAASTQHADDDSVRARVPAP